MLKRGVAGVFQCREIVARMIGGARQRARGDKREAFGEAPLPVGLKFFWGYVSLHGSVGGCWAEILADGEKVDIGPAQIVHHRVDLRLALAQAEHDAGFGEELRIERLGPR